MEELTDILVRFEQRISARQHRLQELEKNHRRLGDEITTIKKYSELPGTLHRAEADKVNVSVSKRGPNTFEALQVILIHAV